MNSQHSVQTAPKPDKKTYLWVTAAVCFFAFLIIEEVQLPKMLILGMTVVSGMFLLFKGVKRPEIVTYALVAYMPFSRELAGDFLPALNFTNILMVFMLFVWVSGRYAEGEPLWLRTSLNVPIFLFLLMGFISICRGSFYDITSLGGVLINYKRWITPILFFFLVLNTVKDRAMIKNVSIIMMIVTTVAALMAIWTYFDQGDMGSIEKSRVGGICEQPNMLAAFFNYYMFLVFGFFLLNLKRAKYWLLLIPFLLCFRGIMVTFSRGGYLAFALGLYAITFFRNKILFIILLLVGLLVYSHPDLLPAGVRYRMSQTVKSQGEYSETMKTEYNEGDLDASAGNRVKIWRGGLEMVKDNPVFGVGYGLFPLVLKYYVPDLGEADAHNTYLIITGEMGIPALIIFLWIILLIFLNTRSLYLRTKDPFAKALALGWLGGLFGLLLSNMFGSRLDSQEVSSYLWILAALVMRLRILDKRESAGLGTSATKALADRRTSGLETPNSELGTRGGTWKIGSEGWKLT